MKYRALLLLTLALLVAGGCPRGTAGVLSPCGVAVVDQPVPDFSFTTLTGEKRQLSSLRGKVVVADFWAILCLGCVAGLAQYQNDPELLKNPKVALVAFCTDRSEAAVRGFAAQQKYTFPVALATDPIRSALGVTGQSVLPQVRILDAQGHLRYVLGPEQATHETVKCLIQQLTGEKK
jgi:peroxiredoxin